MNLLNWVGKSFKTDEAKRILSYDEIAEMAINKIEGKILSGAKFSCTEECRDMLGTKVVISKITFGFFKKKGACIYKCATSSGESEIWYKFGFINSYIFPISKKTHEDSMKMIRICMNHQEITDDNKIRTKLVKKLSKL